MYCYLIMINWYTNMTNRAFVIIGYKAKTAPRLSGCCERGD